MFTMLATTACAVSWKAIAIIALAAGATGGAIGSAVGGPVTGAFSSTVLICSIILFGVIFCLLCSALSFIAGSLLKK